MRGCDYPRSGSEDKGRYLPFLRRWWSFLPRFGAVPAIDALYAVTSKWLGWLGQRSERERVVQNSVDEQRLRFTHQVAELILVRDSPGVVQAWFQGLNPQLDDRSRQPLWDGDVEDARPLARCLLRPGALLRLTT